jgi:hypothetical protein
MIDTKHIVCFSQGHSSALVAIEVARKFGTKDLLLINHAMNPDVEEEDIRRFGKQVSEAIGVPITYVNYQNIYEITYIPTQFEICNKIKAIKSPRTSSAICTYELKTKPFNTWLATNFPNKNCIIYYGFDAIETNRVTRRASILGAMGYKSDYPLALWEDRTIFSTKDIGISPPNVYGDFKHANCTGCLKAGIWHWYVTYCKRKDLFEAAKNMEEETGYTILRKSINGKLEPFSLEEFEQLFSKMQSASIPPTEHLPIKEQRQYLKKYYIESIDDTKPCECFV